MNTNESIFTAMLRVASTNYHPVRVSRTAAVPGLVTFQWKKEYEHEDTDDIGDARSTNRTFEDRDLWLTEAEVQQLIIDPERFMGDVLKSTFKNQRKDWELFVTEYQPQMAKVYNQEDVDGTRKKLRKAALLAAMSPEDRKLFES